MKGREAAIRGRDKIMWGAKDVFCHAEPRILNTATPTAASPKGAPHRHAYTGAMVAAENAHIILGLIP